MLNLAFLGVPEIRHSGQTIIFPTRKTLALLVYLAIERSLQPRPKLIELLWPQSDETRGRGSLRRAVLQLRQGLPEVDETSSYFISAGEMLGINWNSQIELDVMRLQSAFHLARNVDLAAGPVQLKEWIAVLQPAAWGYRGDFLEGFSLEDAPGFDDWASLQRETCHRRVSLVFDRLAQMQVEVGDQVGAIETATKWISHDSLNEAAYTYLMQLYLDSGNILAARQVYEACSQILEREFGAKPSAQTQALNERIYNAGPVAVPASTLEKSPVKPATGTPQRILLVDDDEDVLTTLGSRLTHSGYEITALTRPQDCLVRLSQENYDLLITDAMMPGMSGYDLVKAVRSIPALRALPVIMLTSLDSGEDALQAFRDGVDDFLTKPWKVEVLFSKIRRLLNREEGVQPPSHFRDQATTSGVPGLDQALGGNWPNGTNLLVLGDWGSGKSTFAHHFMSAGLVRGEPGLWINFDDSPDRVKHSLNLLCGSEMETSPETNLFRLVDAGSFYPEQTPDRSFDSSWDYLSNLTRLIMEAGTDLRQTARQQAGGRRVLDSISSLFLQFDLPTVQRFLLQIARTAQSYGRVSTLFIVEREAVEDRLINQIKYFMDGIVEMRQGGNYQMRVINHRWQTHTKDWFDVRYFR